MFRQFLYRLKYILFFGLSGLLLYNAIAFGAGGGGELGGEEFGLTLLGLGLILIFSKIGALVERIGWPSVLGELLVGVILGNLYLLSSGIIEVEFISGVFGFFKDIAHNDLIEFLSKIGVIILLFQIGLESDLGSMKKVGVNSLLVAITGVVLPILMGMGAGFYLLPEAGFNTWLFLGAALAATSVGITMSVFKDMGKINSKEGQVVLGAAVIDDIMGVIILSILTALVNKGAGNVEIIDVGYILAQAIIFLVGAILIGKFLQKPISKLFSYINTGVGMKFTIIITFCFLFAYIASLVGLEPIIGAFAAGLILDSVYFKYYKDHHLVKDIKEHASNYSQETKESFESLLKHHEKRDLEDLVEPIGMMLVPVFFVFTGMQLDVTVFSNINIVWIALIFTVIAFVSKYISGFFAGSGANKHVVGIGMAPRGEVGLVFASIGLSIGAINQEVFSIIIIVVIFTTFIAPIILNKLLEKENS